ncbi:MAG: ferredoxin-type protein NapG [Gammaproteobacteria bacterium]|nr:MAG: ferredoxin-type protein NapG [Gammaproteobacteria bacterium]
MDKIRRKFLTDSLKTASAVGIGSLVLGLYARQSKALPAQAIRPPGALAEDDFLGACIRCGLCVRDCPYDTLRLSMVGAPVALGSPYFVAREIPCEMCEDIPCVVACPTGALDHDLTDINDARMGLAVVIDQEGCIAFQGLRCEVCFNVCPIRGDAITLEIQHNKRTGMHARFIPVVHSDHCTGCGKCEQACILDNESAIKVVPIKLASSGGSGHYRKGWEEKRKHGGKPLVTPDTQHEFNLPEGMDYDYAGKGLIEKKDKAGPKQDQSGDSPFSSNPLDTLNKRGKF